MSEILSQNEIDALLSALSSGELVPEENAKDEDFHKVKKYDFSNPQKFSKDQIRTLELIHDNFARILSNYLSAQLRVNVKVTTETVEQVPYEEFIRSISNPTVLTIFKMPPLNGSILFETNPGFAYEVIDILLGGSGGRSDTSRELTDIDKNLLRSIYTGIIGNMKLAWEDLFEVQPEIEGIETNPALNQTLAPNEPVALITFSVEINKNHTFINICIPYLSIEKMLDSFVVQYWFQDNEVNTLKESREQLKKRMDIVGLKLMAVLGTTSITIDDFLRLSEGDVITLDEKIDSPVKLKIEDQDYCYGKPGLIGKKMGVQILDLIENEVDSYE